MASLRNVRSAFRLALIQLQKSSLFVQAPYPFLSYITASLPLQLILLPLPDTNKQNTISSVNTLMFVFMRTLLSQNQLGTTVS
jgi:hypothetical protein